MQRRTNLRPRRWNGSLVWSLPNLKPLGRLDVSQLSEGSPVDVVFSSYQPGRMWLIRNAPHVFVHKDGKDVRVPGENRLALWTRFVPADESLGKEKIRKLVSGLSSEHYETRQKAYASLRDVSAEDVKVLDSIAADGADGQARLRAIRQYHKEPQWRYTARSLLVLPAPAERFADHPNGKHWVAYGEETLMIGDIDGRTLRLIRTTKRPIKPTSMLFTRGGELLIGTAAGTVEIYRLVEN